MRCPAAALGCRRTLGMRNAAAGRHPVHVAGADRLHAAEIVAVLKGAFEQVGHRGQPDMRMRTHVDALTGREPGRADMVEEDKGPDVARQLVRQHAAQR